MTLRFAIEITCLLTYWHITQYRPVQATVAVGKGGVGWWVIQWIAICHLTTRCHTM